MFDNITLYLNQRQVVRMVAFVILLLAVLFGSVGMAGASDPFIEIVKTGPDTAVPGEQIIFTLTLKTYASGEVTHVVVWDELFYASVDKYEIFRRDLTAEELATLNAGGAVVIEVPYRVPCDAGGHVIDNDAYAQATFADGTVKTAANDHDVPIPRPNQVECTPAIDLEKWVNGHDADTAAEAVVATAGDLLTFAYIVTNTGDAALFNIVVVDDNETPADPGDDIVIGTIPSLAPGQSETLYAQRTAESGLHTNVGEACGTSSGSSGSQYLCDTDPANYIVPVTGEGCTPGFWKQEQHFDSWVNYDPNDYFNDIFGVPYNKTLLQALEEGGGQEKALGRHAVAALLNAANPDVDYLYSEAEIIAMVQDAYATGDFESLKDALEEENERGCSLD